MGKMDYTIDTLDIEIAKIKETLRKIRGYEIHPEYCSDYGMFANQLRDLESSKELLENCGDIKKLLENTEDPEESDRWAFKTLHIDVVTLDKLRQMLSRLI